MQPVTPQPAATFAVPQTLKDFNAHLARLGLPCLEQTAFAALRAREPRDRLVDALRRAQGSDANALAYLRRVIGNPQIGPAAPSSPPTLRIVTRPAASSAPTTISAAGKSTPPPSPPTPDPLAGSLSRTSAPEPRRLTLHVYGQQGALTVEADQTRDGFHTLALDAAQSSGPRQFDWNHKLRLQLTRQELPVVVAVLTGILPGCEFGNHGPDNNKGFSLQHQADRGVIFCRVFTKGRVIAVPISAQDAYYVTALALHQLRANTPWLTGTDLLATLRATVGRLKITQARQLSKETPT